MTSVESPSGGGGGEAVDHTSDDSPVDEPDGLGDGDDLGSGFLADSSRRAALTAALPFVATYFVRSDQLQLRSTAVLGNRAWETPSRYEPPRDAVLAALRLRTALTAGQRLVEALQAALRSANFRFERVTDEHIGHLHGRLDIPRYLQQRGRRTVPRRYPVVDVQRSSATPENILAAFAAHWHLTELDACLLALDGLHRTPELHLAEQVRADLVRLHSHPTLRGASEDAVQVAHRETVGQLLDTVEARLRAGHVSRPGGYERVAAWVHSALSGSADISAGEVSGAFYGPQFDDKLFELWCLAQLAEALTALLGPARLTAPHLLNRDSKSPLFTWDAGADVIELYFQPALSELVGAPNRWRYQPGDRPLRGFPDLAARCRHVDGTSEVVLIDAKLRRRRSARGQELYKLLGYLANAGRPIHLGGLIFHAPTGFHAIESDRRWTVDRAAGDEPGIIEMVAVDPGDPVGSADAFAILGRLVLSGTGVPAEQIDAAINAGMNDPDATEEEQEGTRAQALAVAQLEARASQLSADVLTTTGQNLHALLEDTWLRVGPDAQRMITTAVHFGVTAPEGADLSGPVLGLCAPLERLLRERVALPALANALTQPGCNPERWTLGSMILRLREAVTGPSWRAPRELRRHLAAAGVDLDSLSNLLTDLDQLRERHRNTAAHRGLVERAQWSEVYRVVLRADSALLPRLVKLLALDEPSSESDS